MSAVGQTVESVEKASDGLYKLLIGGLAAGAVGAVAYGLWKCYQKKGKLDGSTITQCLIEDLAYLGLKMAEGTGKEALEAAKNLYEDSKGTPLNPFKGKGKGPVSDWLNKADEKVTDAVKSGAGSMFKEIKKDGGTIAHVFKDPKEAIKPIEAVTKSGKAVDKAVETAGKAVGHEASKIAHKIGGIFHF